MKLNRTNIFSILLLNICLFHNSPSYSNTLCEYLGDMANTVMNSRQEGAAMSDMMKHFYNDDTMPTLKDMHKSIIISAYEIPRYSTNEMQHKATQDFRNIVELNCYKNM